MATIVQRKIWIDRKSGKRFESKREADRHAEQNPKARLKVKDLGWQARVRRRGHRPLSRTFDRKSDAEAWAATIETEIRAGQYVDRRQAERETLKQLIEQYEDEFNEHKAKTSTDRYRLKTLKKELGFFTAGGLKAEDIVEYATKRLRAVKPSSVSRELSILSDILTTAQAVRRISLAADPVAIARKVLKKQRRLGGSDRRSRRLNPQEERALLTVRHSRPTLIPKVIEFALETAMRCGEIAAMRRQDIDWQAGLLRIPVSKTDWKTSESGRTIPLSPKALAILRSLPTKRWTRGKDGVRVLNDAIWGYTDPHSISRAFARTVALVNRAHQKDPAAWPKIEDLRFHDLRHEATTRLFERGWSMMEVAAITGHRSPAMLARYTHLRPTDLRRKLASTT